MKQLFSLTTVLLLSIFSHAQVSDRDFSKSDFSNETIYRFNLLLTPNFEIEKDVTEDISILANAGVGIYYYEQNNFFSNSEGFLFPFQFEIAGRYYTNFNRRLNLGKTIINNSGNYIGASYINSFETENDDVILYGSSGLLGNYGIQRTYWKHFNLNFQTGLGYDFQQGEAIGQLILKLGYTF